MNNVTWHDVLQFILTISTFVMLVITADFAIEHRIKNVIKWIVIALSLAIGLFCLFIDFRIVAFAFSTIIYESIRYYVRINNKKLG